MHNAGTAHGRISGYLSGTDATGTRFDFPGCTILPGLIDTHVHLVMAALSTNEAIIEQVGAESDEQPSAPEV